MDEHENSSTLILSKGDFCAFAKTELLPRNLILVQHNPDLEKALSYSFYHEPNDRMKLAVIHLNKIFKLGGLHKANNQARLSFVFQSDDQSEDFFSASWEIKPSYKDVCLLPDLYYTRADGYSDFLVGDVPSLGDASRQGVLARHNNRSIST